MSAMNEHRLVILKLKLLGVVLLMLAIGLVRLAVVLSECAQC